MAFHQTTPHDDKVGDVHGDLTVVEILYKKSMLCASQRGPNWKRQVHLRCRCVCGSERVFRPSDFTRFYPARSCGTRNPMHTRRIAENIKQIRILEGNDLRTPITPLREQLRQKLKITVFPAIRERDHYTCALCGDDHAAQVHHIHPSHSHPELRADPLNLVTLCRDCHRMKAHGGKWSNIDKVVQVRLIEYVNGHHDQTQWQSICAEIEARQLTREQIIAQKKFDEAWEHWQSTLRRRRNRLKWPENSWFLPLGSTRRLNGPHSNIAIRAHAAGLSPSVAHCRKKRGWPEALWFMPVDYKRLRTPDVTSIKARALAAGIEPGTAVGRKLSGWPEELWFALPGTKYKPRYNSLSLASRARAVGLSRTVVEARKLSGWPEELWFAPLGTHRPKPPDTTSIKARALAAGIRPMTAGARKLSGWPEELWFAPLGTRYKMGTTSARARAAGISPSGVAHRKNAGWPEELWFAPLGTRPTQKARVCL
jgi:5-methylcytosine-specific restriction endonuclease McrA